MKRISRVIVFALLALAFSECRSASASQKTDVDKIKQEVIALDIERGKALQNKDFTFMDNLYDDSWIYITPSGQQITKAQYFVVIKSINYKKLNYSEYNARVYGDTVILNLINEVKAITPLGDLGEKLRYTRVYVKKDNGWKFVSQQGTPILEK